MGYEVCFKYCKRNPETGNYDKENIETLSKKLGKATDDVSTDKLAFMILNQMSRRDIFVTDVEIYEFVKKKVEFKEAKNGDGIIIGGRKYGSNTILSDDEDLDLSEDVQIKPTEQVWQQPQPQLSHQDKMLQDLQRQIQEIQRMSSQQQQYIPPPIMQPQQTYQQPQAPQSPQQPQSPQLVVLRYEYFKPDPDLLPLIKAKNLKFTIEKKYPIFSERIAGAGTVYGTQDDTGKRIEMHSMYFVPNIRVQDPTGILQSDDIYGSLKGPKLTHQAVDNYYDNDTGRNFPMPVLRR